MGAVQKLEMSKDLVVGSSGLVGFEESVGRFLSHKGVEGDLDAWLATPESVADLCFLNGASVMALLRHALQLEGWTNESEGFAAGENGRVKARNLPWWDNAIWLPSEFDSPGMLDDDPSFFVGSCQQLLAELDGMRLASSLKLGEVVPEYTSMRADYVGFVRSDPDLSLSDEDTIRWMWRALHDGAELAISHNTVLWACPD